jgi:hypothetical protein
MNRWTMTTFPLLTLLAWTTTAATSNRLSAIEACPFCTAASQTLRQEMLSMDAVAFGSLVADDRAEIDGMASFKIDKVLVGDALIKVNQSIQATYFGPGKSTKRFLLMGVDPKDLVWSSPLPITPEAEKYIEGLRSLPEDPIQRLAFYQNYFEHPDSLLARDCYDEFALAPYADVLQLKDQMNRKQLLAWVQDTSKAPDRKRLYYTMLGICGLPEDADLFERLIRSSNPDDRGGLDALIAAFLTIRGDKGLSLVEEKFFKDTKTQYADIYSAVMALRFHGTEGGVLKKEGITKAMHQLLERPDLADLVIPDLARWGDWSQVDKLTKLFEEATDENLWVRVPVVNYLRACPLPEAKEKLTHLEKIDPAAVKRAKTFFPIPAPVAPKNESSSLKRNNPLDRTALIQQLRFDERHQVTRGSKDDHVHHEKSTRFKKASSIAGGNALVSLDRIEDLNLFIPLGVVACTTLLFFCGMWIVASSSVRRPKLMYLPRVAN